MTRRHRGRRDQAARAALAPLVASGAAVCWRCRTPIQPGQEWDAGHLVDLAAGGDPAGERLPEHRRKADCPKGGNRAAGGWRRWHPHEPARVVRLDPKVDRLSIFPRRRPTLTHLWPRFSPPAWTLSRRNLLNRNSYVSYGKGLSGGTQA